MNILNCLAKSASVGILVLLIQSPAIAEDVPLPSGWRTPTNSELNEDWRNKDSDKYAIVRGDFNGDGIVDQAMLLMSRRGHDLGLFVFLYQENHTFKAYRINVIKDVSFLQVMGITKVSPGKYETACGKGYWKCKKDETPEISNMMQWPISKQKVQALIFIGTNGQRSLEGFGLAIRTRKAQCIAPDVRQLLLLLQ